MPKRKEDRTGQGMGKDTDTDTDRHRNKQDNTNTRWNMTKTRQDDNLKKKQRVYGLTPKAKTTKKNKKNTAHIRKTNQKKKDPLFCLLCDVSC